MAKFHEKPEIFTRLSGEFPMQLLRKAGRSSEDLICAVLTKKGQDVVVGSSPVVYFALLALLLYILGFQDGRSRSADSFMVV